MLPAALSPGQSAAAQSQAQTAASQKKVINALGRLDSRIETTSARAKKGKKVGTFIKSRAREVTKLVDTNMTAPIDGVKGSQWYKNLHCVDLGLMQATLRAKQSLKKGSVDRFLSSATGCEQSLQGALRGAGSPSALTSLAELDGALQTAIGAAKRADPSVAGQLAAIEKQKLAIVDASMVIGINGVEASQWFRKLDCVDIQLTQAKLRDKKALKRGKIRSMLGKARKCAQTLKADLSKATTSPSPATAITFGSNNLSATPQSLVGRFNEDVQYWPTKLGAQPPAANYVASPTAPADGRVTEIKVRGYAMYGDNPAGSAQPIRFSVARPQPNGQLIVITTTDPPFSLPGTDGTYTFNMNQVRFACCTVKKGDYVSIDSRFGEQALFARVPGSITDHFSPPRAEPSQNPGYLWTGKPSPDVELLMQVTEQPGG